MGPHKQMKRYGLILLTSVLLLLYLGSLSLPDLSGASLPPPRPLFGQRSLKKSEVDYIETETHYSNIETQSTPYKSNKKSLSDKQIPNVQDVLTNINNKPVKKSVIQKPGLPNLVNSQRKQQGLQNKLITTIYKNVTLSKKPVINVGNPVGSVPYHEILKTQPKSKLKPVYIKPGRPGSMAFNKSRKLKPKKQDSLFTFRDMKLGGPYHNTSPPLTYALNTAKTYLNYEFSEKKFPKVAVPRPGMVFKEEAANRMDIAEDMKVGTALKPQQTRHILIATTWRSGSSFFGSVINSYPGSFYYFEPLHYYSRKNNASLFKSQDKVDFLKTLFACQFDSRNLGFLHHVSQPANRFLFMNHNNRLWKSCSRILPGQVFCFMSDTMKAVCPLYPIKLMKTVRLRVADTRKLLQDSELNMKVIVLVRDPRGVFASRRAKAISEWCKQDECAKPATSCQNLILDLESARELEAEFPGRIILIRYEDLSLDPVHSVRSVLRFLDLPERKEIMDYIETHTNKDKPTIIRNKMSRKLERKMNPYALARNSSATAYKWRQSMPWQDIQDIQETCSDAMDALGYTALESEIQTKSEELPIILQPNDLWPSDVWQN